MARVAEMRIRIDVSQEKIESFCQRHSIRWLAFLGSALRDDFTPESA